MILEGWKTSELSAIMKADLHGNADVTVRHVVTDSRRLSFPDDTIFFALKTFKNDGHRYIPELFAKGVRTFVVNQLPQVHRDDANYLVVNDTFEALHQLAKEWRGKFDFPILAITGSNGKTIVKEWIHQLLHSQFRIVRSPRSYNSQLGVPLSVLYMREGHQLGIFEAGISQVGEMDKLRDIIKPKWGVFTNIGDAHQEHFESQERKLQEKLNLFEGVQHLIFSSEDEKVYQAIQERFSNRNIKLVSWGSDKAHSDLWIKNISEEVGGTLLDLRWKSSKVQIHLPFTDQASIDNAMHAIAFSLAFGCEPKVLVQAVEKLTPIAMRLELKKARGGSTLINDAYNSDLQSIRIALDFLHHQKQNERGIVILSDVEQSGVEEGVLYQQIAKMLEERQVSMLIGIGPKISSFREHFAIPSYFYPNTSTFLTELAIFDLSNANILLKGARTFAFEKIAHAIEEKAHQTVLEINLSAISHNLNYYRKMLRPETKIMVMVKAFGYGAGYGEIANVLEFDRVDWLAVAYADEGVALRKAGIKSRIMVMNPNEESFDQILEFDLEPEIYSFRILQAFHRAVQNHSDDAFASAVPIHIKVETGMNRLGFAPDEIDRLADEILAMPGIRVSTIFSHLASSDDPKEEAFTQSQIEKLKKASDHLIEGLGYPVLRHILNSSGIHNYIDAQLDMVRLGIGLYGVTSVSWERHHLRRVSRLITQVSQIHKINAGESVGYGRSFMAEHPMRVATLPIGYADGIDRRLSNGGGEVSINGQRASIIGKVCMDMIMVDVTAVDCEEGDEVEIFGEHISIYEFAQRTGTIPYEILTSISSRVKRVYHYE